jgi:hypothetical protein
MLHKNLSSFLSEENHHGTVVFTSDNCFLCEQFEKDLITYDTSTWVSVEVTTSEQFILETLFNVRGFPFTIVFVNSKPALVKQGVLSKTRIDEVFSFMKVNNLSIKKTTKTPLMAYTPVIIAFPTGHTEYKIKAFHDSISRGESPIEFNTMYSDILDMNNPHSIDLIRKLRESWSILVKKTIIYVDEGVDNNMLNEVLDATTHGREIEFRKCDD